MEELEEVKEVEEYQQEHNQLLEQEQEEVDTGQQDDSGIFSFMDDEEVEEKE